MSTKTPWTRLAEDGRDEVGFERINRQGRETIWNSGRPNAQVCPCMGPPNYQRLISIEL
jgi:hypothetical protein